MSRENRQRRRRSINTPGHAHELIFTCYRRFALVEQARDWRWSCFASVERGSLRGRRVAARGSILSRLSGSSTQRTSDATRIGRVLLRQNTSHPAGKFENYLTMPPSRCTNARLGRCQSTLRTSTFEQAGFRALLRDQRGMHRISRSIDHGSLRVE